MKLKRKLGALLMVTMMISLAGCGDNSNAKTTAAAGNTVQSVLDQQVEKIEEQSVRTVETDSAQTNPVQQPEETVRQVLAGDSEYDLDLTKLGSTMIYSEVYNMMLEPESYVGKSIRMQGNFAIYQAADEEGKPIPNQLYFACVIADASACCSQGLEFVLAGDYVFPNDYPEPGTFIRVSGIFETYEENGHTFTHLVDAVFEDIS